MTNTSVSLTEIHVLPGFNPRQHFSEPHIARLADSIREHGLIQPLVVRPRDEGGYWLIAGECRLRALRQAAVADAPVHIRDVSLTAARKLALLENIERSDLAPSEEARSARDLLAANENDHDLTARELGWSPNKLRARLLLLHCCENVLQALDRRDITLGHAELLAGIPEPQQEKALPTILEKKYTVEQVREAVRGVSIPLAQAVFDLEGCRACVHNSAVQSDMFSVSIGAGRCLNRECFTAKTNVALEDKRIALKQDVSAVVMATEVDEATTTLLVAKGAAGVGPSQFDACKKCVHFGAIIDNRIGERTGAVKSPVCMNLACHTGMVKSYQDEVAAEQADTTATAGKASTGTGSRKPVKKPERKPAAADVSKGLNDQFDAIHGRAAVALAASSKSVVLACALAMVLRNESDSARSGAFSEFGLRQSAPDALEAFIASASTLDPAVLVAKLRASVANILSAPHAEYVPNGHVKPRVLRRALIEAHEPQLAAHVRVDEPFLAAHTRAGIEAVLAESGFDAWMKAQPDGEVRRRKMGALGKAELVKAVLAAEFDWTGYVPSGARLRRRTKSSKAA